MSWKTVVCTSVKQSHRLYDFFKECFGQIMHGNCLAHCFQAVLEKLQKTAVEKLQMAQANGEGESQSDVGKVYNGCHVRESPFFHRLEVDHIT